MASKYVMLCVSIALLALLTPSDAQPGVPGPPQPPTKKVTKQDISKICSKALDKKYCLDTISAIPASNRTNLHDLTLSVIAAANTLATNSYNAIQSMIASTEEAPLKDAFTLCAQHYYNAREEFYSCNFNLNAPTFYLVSVHVLLDLPKNGIVEIKTCEMDLQQAQPNSPVTPLTNTNNKMIIAIDLVGVVGTYLFDSLKKAGRN